MNNKKLCNLVELNNRLKHYSSIGKVEHATSAKFLIKFGNLVINHTDITGKKMSVNIAYFDPNKNSLNLVNKLISKYSN